MERALIDKLDLCIKRTTGHKHFDNLIVIDGDEGYGKTTLSVAAAYYIAEKTGREMRYFFNLDDLIKYAASNKEKVIIWDEAALGGLGAEWQNKTQQKLIKLLMVARKKRHFWIFNIPKFFKLAEYILIDRAIGLIHVYSPDENRLGLFYYYKKRAKEHLFHHFRKTKNRAYKKFKSFRGTFPNVAKLPLIDWVQYDKDKDEAILSVASMDEKATGKQLEALAFKYLYVQHNRYNFKEIMKHLNVSERTLNRWARYDKDKPEINEFLLEKYGLGQRQPTTILKEGLNNEKESDR